MNTIEMFEGGNQSSTIRKLSNNTNNNSMMHMNEGKGIRAPQFNNRFNEEEA